jgi:Uma2 family endonuclease
MNEATAETTMELHDGATLNAEEFLQAYEGMPHVRKAELHKGLVCNVEQRPQAGAMMSPVHLDHSTPLANAIMVLSMYAANTPGVRSGSPATVALSAQTVVEPDAILFRVPGQSRRHAKGYLQGPPELVVEVGHSSARKDEVEKAKLYYTAGVLEYLFIRKSDVQLFRRGTGQFEAMARVDGRLQSETFPGLWIDAAALLAGEGLTLIRTLYEGLAARQSE